MQQSIEYALEHNNDVMLKEFDKKISQTNKINYFDIYGPKVFINSELAQEYLPSIEKNIIEHQNKNTSTSNFRVYPSLNMLMPTGTKLNLHSEAFNSYQDYNKSKNYVVRLNVEQPLLKGVLPFETKWPITENKLHTKIKQIESKKFKQNLVVSIVTDYLELAKSEQAINIAATNLDNYNKLKQSLDLKFNLGKISEFEIKRVNLEHKIKTNQLLRAKQAHHNKLLEFQDKIGLKSNRQVIKINLQEFDLNKLRLASGNNQSNTGQIPFDQQIYVLKNQHYIDQKRLLNIQKLPDLSCGFDYSWQKDLNFTNTIDFNYSNFLETHRHNYSKKTYYLKLKMPLLESSNLTKKQKVLNLEQEKYEYLTKLSSQVTIKALDLLEQKIINAEQDLDFLQQKQELIAQNLANHFMQYEIGKISLSELINIINELDKETANYKINQIDLIALYLQKLNLQERLLGFLKIELN